MRVRAQPAGDVHGQDQAPISGPWQRRRGQRGAQPLDVKAATAQRGIQRAMTPTMLTDQRQLHLRPHRPIGAQHRVGQLKHRVSACAQTVVELLPERRQLPDCAKQTGIVHTDHRNSPWLLIFFPRQEE
jgi:hypothetical protein